MKRIGAFCFLVVVLILSGCNTLGRQPQLRDALVTPSELSPGESAVITVKVYDRYDIVESVVGVVVEDERLKFELLDDGQPPDVEAGDGIWSLMVDVPFLAQPGQFTLEFTACDARGEAVVVKTKDGVSVLKQSCIVTIRYEGEDLSPAPSAGPAQESPAEAS